MHRIESSEGQNILSKPMNRRAAVRLLGGFGAAAAAGAFAVARPSPASAVQTGWYTTTTALNLRSGPGSTYGVILVMPAYAPVEYLGQTSNGFRKVAYQGKAGWAHQDFLAISNGPDGPGPVFIGAAKTTAAVNLRSGPSNGHTVLRVVPAGAWVDVSDAVRYGYRYVKHNGLAGWIFDDYLGPDSGGANPGVFTTTAAVNLRAQPNTSAAIKLVVPSGATVIDYDGELVNGYRGVDYKGTVGWVYDAYLA